MAALKPAGCYGLGHVMPLRFLVPPQDELVWNDGVAPEACLDFDAPHISKWTALAWWVGAFVFLYANYKLITLFDVQNWKKTVRGWPVLAAVLGLDYTLTRAVAHVARRLPVSSQKPAVQQKACMMMRTTRQGHALFTALTKLLLVLPVGAGLPGRHAVELLACARVSPLRQDGVTKSCILCNCNAGRCSPGFQRCCRHRPA